MRVRRVEIVHGPGVAPGFTFEGLGPGLTIVEGRNESGKSTLARAIGALLWPRRHEGLRARGVFEHGGVEYHSYIDAHGGGWQGPAPALPDESAGRSLIVGIADLWQEGEHDRAIRRAMTRQLQGGYDLAPLRDAAQPRSPTKPMADFREAEQRLHRARVAAQELLAQEARLPQWREAVDRLTRSASRLPLVERALQRLDRLEELSPLREQLAAMPQGALRVRGDEDRRARELQEAVEQAHADIQREVLETQRASRALEALGLPDAGVPAGDLEVLGQLASEALALERLRADAQREAQRARALVEAFGVEPRALDGATLDALDAALGRVHEARERRMRDRAALEQPPPATASRGRALPMALVLALLLTVVTSAFALAWVALGLSLVSLLLAVAIVLHRRGPRGDDAAFAEQRAGQSEGDYQRAMDDLRRIALVDDELASTLSVVTAARRAHAHDGALLDWHAKMADAESLHEQLDDVLGRASALLWRYSIGPCASVDALVSARTNLAQRADEHRRLTVRHAEAAERAEAGQRRLERAEEHWRSFLDRLTLTEDRLGELHEWLRFREKAQSLEAGIRDQEAVLRSLEHALEGDRELLRLGRATLLQHKHECERAGAEANQLRESIGETRGALERARQSADVLHALGECHARAAAVAEQRDAECAKAARLLVLDHAVAGAQREDMPALVNAADERLLRFTANAYGLRVDASHTPVVHDLRTGHSKGDEQLSTGTRAQVLLALRLAGALEAESRAGAGPLPLILDEPLATTDDERFEAVAAALIDMALEGRQLVYLTCEPAHAQRLAHLAQARGAPAARIDLDEVRNRQRTERNPSSALLEPKPRSSPDDLPREAYLQALGVRPLDPWASPQAIDLYHLLADDLHTLHALDLHGLRTVGQLLDQQARLGVGFPWPRVAHAARIAERLVVAWRIGRGRPLTTADLVESGAFGPKFLDHAVSLNDEFKGSAVALLDALERRTDERAKGFQARKLEQLRDDLHARGLLPQGPTLSRAALIERALGTEVIGNPDLDAGLRLVHHLLGVLGEPIQNSSVALGALGA